MVSLVKLLECAMNLYVLTLPFNRLHSIFFDPTQHLVRPDALAETSDGTACATTMVSDSRQASALTSHVTYLTKGGKFWSLKIQQCLEWGLNR